jgi:hypothetical protein
LAARERLKSRILRLLKEDEEFRYAVAGLIGLEEILRRLDRHEEEIIRLREDMMKGFERHDREIERLREDMVKGFERHDREIQRLTEEMNKLREDMVKGFERHDREIAKLREDMMRGFDLVNRHISAIGARWGIMTEDAFREGLRGILEKEFGVKVERWVTRDEDGIVYGFSSVIEIDIAIKDGKTMLIEISSSVDRSKLAAFLRKARLYEKKTGIKPIRLIMVTPYADENAIAAAKEVNVEIYTKV